MLAQAMALILAALLTGCAELPSREQPPPFREWQVVETASGRPVEMDSWLQELAAKDIVYLGEEHHNRHHVEAAVKVIEALVGRGYRPVLAMEMFAWEGQPALDRLVLDGIGDRERFLEKARWRDNWGGAYDDYEPLVRIARERRLPLVALNPPLSLVRRVAKQGLATAQQESEAERWGMKEEPIIDDPEYRERIVRQLQQCHGGGPDSLYQKMYEASMFRDEGMAKTLVQAWQVNIGGPSAEHRPIVSYTGGGHIQYNLPIPKRVGRRTQGAVRQVTIYMTSFEPERSEEVRQMIRDRIADYVWLTPVSRPGPPRRC